MYVTKESFIQLKEILEEFKEFNISPYSESFYDREVGWGEKEEGTLRCSSHWNYTTDNDDEVHSVTDVNIPEKTWAIGKYKDGVYKIIWKSNQKEHDDLYDKMLDEVKENNIEELDFEVNKMFINSDNQLVVRNGIETIYAHNDFKGIYTGSLTVVEVA